MTLRNLKQSFQYLYGFAASRGFEISRLSDLFTEEIVGEFAEWSMEKRKMRSESVRSNLKLIFAAVSQHSAYKSLDLSWYKPFLNSLPRELESELDDRKGEKFLEFDVVEMIPKKIHAERSAAAMKGTKHVARLAMEELLMTWFPILPWRQKNIREMRIGGPEPNLFKGPISSRSRIDKPDWVKHEEQTNPAATFWQIRFSPQETKMKHPVRLLLPRQLIAPVEEYLNDFRACLLRGKDPGTLFVNRAGNQMQEDDVKTLVSKLTLRYGGRRVTPHMFRDIVAFKWLQDHPEDYLTLSKMLWHKNIQTTLSKYSRRFNESSGARAMEGWLDQREAHA